MTTLAAMMLEIQAESSREDWADAAENVTTNSLIQNAIEQAIRKHQRKRYYFNEEREDTFVTVADQAWYSVSDDTDIPLYYKLDGMYVTDTNGSVTVLRRDEIQKFEWLIDNSAASGRPYQYAYYNQKIGLYPIPDIVYTIRLTGHKKMLAPAAAAEADNVWMTEAYDLIKAEASANLYGAQDGSTEHSAFFRSLSDEEAKLLREVTTNKVTYDSIEKTEF